MLEVIQRTREKILSFCRNKEAISAIEFSITAPVFILILLGGFDITRYTIAARRITDISSTIGQMLSVNSTGSVNWTDLQFYHDSAMILYPQVLSDAQVQGNQWSSDIAISMSSINFMTVPPICTTGCIYVPKVVWTSGENPRSCIVPATAAPDTAAPTPSTLPADVFGAASILVVDVVYIFHPMLAQRFFGNLSITRSYYVTPRYVPSVGYTVSSGDTGIATVCP